MKSSNLALRYEPAGDVAPDAGTDPPAAEAGAAQTARRRIDRRPWFERRAIVIRDPRLPLFRVR